MSKPNEELPVSLHPWTQTRAKAKTRTRTQAPWTCDEAVKPFCSPTQEYLATHADVDAVSVGALVFRRNTNHLLILQRATHDSFPSRWEVPGGKCDHVGDGLLGNLVRELYEETGLVGLHIHASVGPGSDPGRGGSDYQVIGEPGNKGYRFRWRGKTVVKYTFLVTVEGDEDVTIDGREHQDFMWASEEECSIGRRGDKELEFTTAAQRDTILEAFKVRRMELCSASALTNPCSLRMLD